MRYSYLIIELFHSILVNIFFIERASSFVVSQFHLIFRTGPPVPFVKGMITSQTASFILLIISYQHGFDSFYSHVKKHIRSYIDSCTFALLLHDLSEGVMHATTVFILSFLMSSSFYSSNNLKQVVRICGFQTTATLLHVILIIVWIICRCFIYPFTTIVALLFASCFFVMIYGVQIYQIFLLTRHGWSYCASHTAKRYILIWFSLAVVANIVLTTWIRSLSVGL